MSTSDHMVGQEEVMAYLEGELALDREAVVAAHVERCQECQRLAGDLQGVSRRLTEWQVSPPRFRPLNFGMPASRGRRLWPRWALGFAGVVVAALAVVQLLQLAQMENRQVASPRLLRPGASMVAQLRDGADSLLEAGKAPMIAHTAELVLATSQFDQARTGLEDIVKRHNGYIGELNVSAASDAGRTLNATLRVPADQLDAALAEVKKLGRVESESRKGEEVTEQYVDLEARLANARNTEQRLTDLLRQRTGKLSDVLSVETELGRVRGEIERMDAQRKNLAKRVEFATLNARVTEDYKAQLHLAPDSTLAQFRNAAVEGYRSMVTGLVSVALALLSYGPSILLLAGILFFPARWAWRKWRPRESAP